MTTTELDIFNKSIKIKIDDLVWESKATANFLREKKRLIEAMNIAEIIINKEDVSVGFKYPRCLETRFIAKVEKKN